MTDTIEQSSIDKTEDILLENQEFQDYGVKAILDPVEKKLNTCVFLCNEEITINCLKCKRPFCINHASRFSPNFCQDCFKALSLIVDKFERRVEDYDAVTDSVITRKETCKRLRLDGPDWVFYTAWIHKLTDEELQVVFEFHYFVVKLIETENEQRKIKNRTKLQGMPLPMGVSTTTETRTKRVAKPKDPLTELKRMFPGKSEAFYTQMLTTMNSAGE
jgi:hypothetical protein